MSVSPSATESAITQPSRTATNAKPQNGRRMRGHHRSDVIFGGHNDRDLADLPLIRSNETRELTDLLLVRLASQSEGQEHGAPCSSPLRSCGLLSPTRRSLPLSGRPLLRVVHIRVFNACCLVCTYAGDTVVGDAQRAKPAALGDALHGDGAALQAMDLYVSPASLIIAVHFCNP